MAQPITRARICSSRNGLRCLLAGMACLFGVANANPGGTDQALERYYAGYPQDAIGILEPLALAGDVDAQNLLGNMLYGLARAGRGNPDDDPVRWYQMAAAQGSADASYALGAIYDNRLLESGRREDALLAEFYYQQAADRGHARAQGPLMKLAARNRVQRRSDSLTYSNSSFSSKQAPAVPAPKASKPPRTERGLAEFRASGDPIADALALEAMLRQLGNPGAASSLLADDGWLDEAALTRLLQGVGAEGGMISDLVKLLGHLRTARELNLSPTANQAD